MDENSQNPVTPEGVTPPAEDTGVKNQQPSEVPQPPASPTPASFSKKAVVILIAILVLLLGVLTAVLFIVSKYTDPTSISQVNRNIKEASGITVVPTLLDPIETDSTWCGTFQLVWNDMKNEVVQQDIVFTDGQLDEVDNLNKSTFTENMISPDYYYKTYGLKTLELKSEIEQGIQDKFGETSDVLNDIDWSDDALNQPGSDTSKYIFYSMLKRTFEYQYAFHKLDDGKFKDQSGVHYFGAAKNSSYEVRSQIDVLYYDSKDSFAIVVNAKDGDQVVYVKNPQGTNFQDIYNNAISKAKDYQGYRDFLPTDEFKAPNLSFNEKKTYDELTNHPFPLKEPGKFGKIVTAIQTVRLTMDENGGSVKSEAIVEMGITSSAQNSAPTEEPDPRYFNVDDTFAVFLREQGKDTPYFAARVNDITKLQ